MDGTCILSGYMALQSSLLAYPILPHQGLFAASGSLLIGIRTAAQRHGSGSPCPLAILWQPLCGHRAGGSTDP